MNDKKILAYLFCTTLNKIHVCYTPIIVGSIISKKVAEQPDALVLDVKFGVGAFIQDKDQSRVLAQKMVKINTNNRTQSSSK